MFVSRFRITPTLAKTLMNIEASRQVIADAYLPNHVKTDLAASIVRWQSIERCNDWAKLTAQSTQSRQYHDAFEHNKSYAQTENNYRLALQFLAHLFEQKMEEMSLESIQVLQGVLIAGEARPILYRQGQSVIRRGSKVIYMPPKHVKIPELMDCLLVWVNEQIKIGELPAPIIAAIAHYQLVTIRPYDDGNKRLAKLLTYWVLYRCQYSLIDNSSFEALFNSDSEAYERALSVGEAGNYYFCRVDADLTTWVSYFCEGLAAVLTKIRHDLSRQFNVTKSSEEVLMRELDRRQRRLLCHFSKNRYITTREVGELLCIHPRTALNLCAKWVDEAFIIRLGEANKSRKYELAEKWTVLIR